MLKRALILITLLVLAAASAFAVCTSCPYPDDAVSNPVACTSTSPFLINWRGGQFNCDDLQHNTTHNGGGPNFLQSANNICANPKFRDLSANDFRLAPYSFLLDRGTEGLETGYPAGRTAAMSNSTARLYAASIFPRMDEGGPHTGQNWDIGPFETRIPRPAIDSFGAFGFFDINTGWSGQPVGGCISALTADDSTVARSGLVSLKMRGRAAGPVCGEVSFTMKGLDTARTYTILGYFQASGSLGVADQNLSIQVDGVQKCQFIPTADVSVWQAFPGGVDVSGACTFTPAAATAVIAIVKQEQAAGDTSYWVDDLEVIVSN